MTESTRTRRSFLRLFTGEEAPEPAKGFSLSRFYAKRRADGEATSASLPEFELAETADFGTTAVGSPDLKPGQR